MRIVVPQDLLARMSEVAAEMVDDESFDQCEWEVDGVTLVIDRAI